MEYVESDLVRIAKRENNTKRKYLVVDPLQGKHIPVMPSRTLDLFTSLADTFRNEYKNERLLLVGFAETATAIGAQVAISIGAKYIQTTREPIPSVNYLFFSEEHSHATEQKLVKDDIDAVVSDVDRLVFIEDEVTTGNTILNIIKILDEEYLGKLKYSVASLLNGMTAEHLELYRSKGIRLHYLVKTDHSNYGDKADEFAGNGHYFDCLDKSEADCTTINVDNRMDARRVVDSNEYKAACENLWLEIRNEIGSVSGKKILVVGTEEFMFPALYVGQQLEKNGNMVLCHSTTRSPIAVSLENDYPLHCRYELKSVYDSERRTFIYDIGEYDRVFVITDSPEADSEGQRTLVNALKIYNDNITVIRWC
ncbi:MAG: hypothetical protein HDQ97_05450 [Lachnospiraceae bacterium]|nr:hypothetical protein [Lachnospiraceae bacterium]